MLTLTPEFIQGRLTVFALLLGVLILILTISAVLVLMARARYRWSNSQKPKPKIVRPDPWAEAGQRMQVDSPPPPPGGIDDDTEPDDDSDDDGDVPVGHGPAPTLPSEAR